MCLLGAWLGMRASRGATATLARVDAVVLARRGKPAVEAKRVAQAGAQVRGVSGVAVEDAMACLRGVSRLGMAGECCGFGCWRAFAGAQLHVQPHRPRHLRLPHQQGEHSIARKHRPRPGKLNAKPEQERSPKPLTLTHTLHPNPQPQSRQHRR